jgi:hypothetical protein
MERITSAVEHNRLNLNIRLWADLPDREVVTDLLHHVLLTIGAILGLRILAATFQRS